VRDDARYFEPTEKERELSLIVAGQSHIPWMMGTPKTVIWRPPVTQVQKIVSHGIGGGLNARLEDRIDRKNKGEQVRVEKKIGLEF